ncbi:MAG TPA: response regulator transcription factor [Tepidiformaceae bacterium]|nr:response regulator transcription factor [Tepidiformaceae bacterium]
MPEAPDAARIRVFICDDHVIVREGLKRLIETADDMEVAGEAAGAAETLARLGESRAQVVLMDIRLPDTDGVQATAAIRAAFPDVRVLALSTFMDDDLIFGAIHAGASGYLAKDVEPERLFDALRAVAGDRPIMSGEVVNRVIQRILSSDAPGAASPNAIDQLTAQERVILGLLAEGMSNQAIADSLVLSIKTVKSHLSNIFGKLGVHTRSQAVVVYMRSQPR